MRLWRRLRSSGGPIRADALSGTCEIRGGRLTGTVADASGVTARPVEIQVVRQNALETRLLARCPAAWDRGRRRYQFGLPVEGLFDGGELLAGRVRVLAVGEAGDSGELALDGATQLELIRAHMSVPAETILDLDFSHGGNARPHLGTGWSGAEAEFTWTVDAASEVFFDRPTVAGEYRLRMTAGALIHKPALPRQDLSVSVNGTPAAAIIKTEHFFQFEECRLPFDLFDGPPRTTLLLAHPDAARPSDLGTNPDGRRLAICMKRLWLVRLLAAED